MNKFFPLFVNLENKKIIVVGAGKIATRRIETLLEFVDGFTVIAQEFSEVVLENSDRLLLKKRGFDVRDLQELTSNDIVLALTDDSKLNENIAMYCHEKNIFVNISTNKELCSFYFPAIASHDGIVAGVTANGQNHKKARFMRERVESAMKEKIIIGSRESKLAVIQTEMVEKYIKSIGLECEILTMKTTGDIILDKTLDKIGGKGLFTKELDKAIMDGRSQLSVHSLKDMPMEVPEELPLLGFSKREDPRDVLVFPKEIDEIDFTKPIGCSSFRRVLQLKELFPNAKFKPIRGNVLTRLEKLDNGEYSALVLAAAGLIRLGLKDRISRYFEPSEMLPAAGQGIVAVQGKKGTNYSYLDDFFDKTSYYMAMAERAFVKTLNGGCSSPVAAFSTIDEGKIVLEGLYYDEKTGDYFKDRMQMNVEDAEKLGVTLANKMKNETPV